MSMDAQIQAATRAYTKLQEEYSKAVESRQRLDAQKSENESVKKELAILTPNNAVYKLIGPVLLRQDQEEAKANVDKRLEFIGGEITRVETQLSEFEKKLESKKMELVKLQAVSQQQQKSGAGAEIEASQRGHTIEASVSATAL